MHIHRAHPRVSPWPSLHPTPSEARAGRLQQIPLSPEDWHVPRAAGGRAERGCGRRPEQRPVRQARALAVPGCRSLRACLLAQVFPLGSCARLISRSAGLLVLSEYRSGTSPRPPARPRHRADILAAPHPTPCPAITELHHPAPRICPSGHPHHHHPGSAHRGPWPGSLPPFLPDGRTPGCPGPAAHSPLPGAGRPWGQAGTLLLFPACDSRRIQGPLTLL